MSLPPVETFAIDLTEKIGSVVSLIGAGFVIVTFISSSHFRKPINRLVFYASWGNIFSNVATLIGTSAIGLGASSPLCQFQGFMIQWFMLVDALWAFCMACNVYLSFFRHYGAGKLRRLEWRYIVACYGLPFIPAFTYCFVSTESRGGVYGDAVLWCWISLRWDFLRIASFYGPAWIVILLAMGIYIRVGCLILQWRSKMRSLGARAEHESRRRRGMSTPILGIRRTEEVIITTEDMIEPPAVYRFPGFRQTRPPARYERPSPNEQRFMTRRRTRSDLRRVNKASNSTRTNQAAIKYCKCAMLFFLALLCTWVPSTVNRIYTLIYPDQIPFGPEYAAGLVLPLQGFWNFVVYVTTSRWACKCCWRNLQSRFEHPRQMSESPIALQAEKYLESPDTSGRDDELDPRPDRSPVRTL